MAIRVRKVVDYPMGVEVINAISDLEIQNVTFGGMYGVTVMEIGELKHLLEEEDFKEFFEYADALIARSTAADSNLSVVYFAL